MTSAEPPAPDAPPRTEVPTWRVILRRVFPVVLSGLVIYVLTPVLAKVFSAWPRLLSLQPVWAVFGLVAEVASFTCSFLLKRIALRTRAVFGVVTSGLVGNAVTNVFPGADATGAAVELRMLSTAGIATGAAVGGLTATAVLQTGSLLALPIFALPAILAGVPISRGLAHLAFLGLGAFALYAVAGFGMFKADWPLRLAGRLAETAHNRVLHHRRPVAGLPERLIEQRNATRTALGAQWWQALLYTFGKVGFDFACLLAMLAATRARPEPSVILVAYSATTVLALLPLTPGGIGIVEGSLTGLLVLADVPAANAFLSTLAYRLASYWLPTLAGPVAYIAFRSRFREAGKEPAHKESPALAKDNQPAAVAQRDLLRTIPKLGVSSRPLETRRSPAAKEGDLAMFVAVYDSVDSAKADLDAIEHLHGADLIGNFDAAVVENEDGKAHVVKRLDRPMVRVIPEKLGFGRLSRKELKELATELGAHRAGLIMLGAPTFEKAFDEAVTHAAGGLRRHR